LRVPSEVYAFDFGKLYPILARWTYVAYLF
jgi:hypothetical protein